MTIEDKALRYGSGAALGSGLAGLALQGRLSPEQPYSPDEHAANQSFMEHAKTWTPRSDPREMIHDYATEGSRAAAASIGPVNVRSVMQARHDLPGSSDWNPSYEAHYRAFEHGPLSGYNMRAHEFQNEYGLTNKNNGMTVGDVLEGAQTGQMAGHPEYTPALQHLQHDVSQAGAAPRADIGDLHGRLLAHQQEIAGERGYGTDLSALNPTQQSAVLDDLNAHVQQHNPQDYVDKQVLDTLMGYDVPRAGEAYGHLAVGADMLGHGANVAHDAGQFMAAHPAELISGGAAGLLLPLLAARMHAAQASGRPKYAALDVLASRR